MSELKALFDFKMGFEKSDAFKELFNRVEDTFEYAFSPQLLKMLIDHIESAVKDMLTKPKGVKKSLKKALQIGAACRERELILLGASPYIMEKLASIEDELHEALNDYTGEDPAAVALIRDSLNCFDECLRSLTLIGNVYNKAKVAKEAVIAKVKEQLALGSEELASLMAVGSSATV